MWELPATSGKYEEVSKCALGVCRGRVVVHGAAGAWCWDSLTGFFLSHGREDGRFGRRGMTISPQNKEGVYSGVIAASSLEVSS
jgi:hypothetical protein